MIAGISNMGKKKEQDRLEELEKENRELKSMVRGLQRRLRKIDKHYKDTEIVDIHEDSEKKFTPKKCEACGKGEIQTVDIVGRMFEKCTTCDYRGRKK